MAKTDTKYAMVAKTFQGLEDILADELIALGAENVQPGLRMVEFEGDLATMYRANLCCRTALRILKPITKFSATNPDELYDMVRDYDWSQLLDPTKTFCIDSTVNSQEFPHSKYVTYRVKDGIADYFYDRDGRRPSIRLTGADVCLNVHISGTHVTISLDSSGEVLSKRGYRIEHNEAPINEALAAGIILKTGWHGECPMVDPMCGSGTFLIEAALIAANIAPGIYRKNFAFEKWSDFDSDLFEQIYNDDSGERPFDFKIYGADISPEAIAITRNNIRNAGVEKMIELDCKAFADWTDVPQDGILITNPPYGERLKPQDIESLYRSIGTTLKTKFQGYKAWVLGYSDENFRHIGLKPSVKIPIMNGPLECELREYVMFDGRYNAYREAGGSMDKELKRAERTQKRVARLSEREWIEETKKYKRLDRRQKTGDRRQKTGDRRQKTGDRRQERKEGRANSSQSSRKSLAPWQRSQRNHPDRLATINDHGPSIPADREIKLNPSTMRSRRKKRENDD